MSRIDGGPPPIPDPRALPEGRGDPGAGLGAGNREAGTNLSNRERGRDGTRRDTDFALALAAATTGARAATGADRPAGKDGDPATARRSGEGGREGSGEGRRSGMAKGEGGGEPRATALRVPAAATEASPPAASGATALRESGGDVDGQRQDGEPRLLAVAHPQVTGAVQPAAAATSTVGADIVSLATRIEAELDAALKLSGRPVGGGIELTLAIQGTGLALSGLTVIARGGELTVALQLGDGIPSGTLAAAAQELAAQLSQRFPRRTIRVEEAGARQADAALENGPENAQAALSALFRR